MADKLGTIEIGNIGEEKAVEYLKAQGFKVLETKWHYRHKEIDIIAQKDELLIIVEVKLRNFDSLESPEAAVTLRKQKFLIEAANAYIYEKDLETETRFDIISVLKKGETYSIEHIDDAFTPNW